MTRQAEKKAINQLINKMIKMGLIAKQSETDINFEKAPEGNHLAVCFSVIDLGIQTVDFQGVTSQKRKIRLSWELPQELMSEGEYKGRPFSISKNYTLSLHEKSVLYKDLISWRGRAFTKDELAGFDVFNVLGASCMINVIHTTTPDGKTYANVASVAQLPKGMAKMQPCNDLVRFNTEDHTADEYNSLPEWLRDKVNLPQAVEHDPAAPDVGGSFDDDIPF